MSESTSTNKGVSDRKPVDKLYRKFTPMSSHRWLKSFMQKHEHETDYQFRKWLSR